MTITVDGFRKYTRDAFINFSDDDIQSELDNSILFFSNYFYDNTLYDVSVYLLTAHELFTYKNSSSSIFPVKQSSLDDIGSVSYQSIDFVGKDAFNAYLSTSRYGIKLLSYLDTVKSPMVVYGSSVRGFMGC